jgi:hypothetical protein
MPIRRSLAGLGAAAALAAALAAPSGVPATPAAATTAADTRTFDITLSGIRAGELTLSAARNGASYEAGSSIRATGLVGAVARIRYDGASTGRIAGDGSLIPERHVARSRSPRSERETEIVFENGQPTKVTVTPPRSRQVDPAEQAGTVDPVSAAFALLLDDRAATVCNERVDLFDGSRRAQVVIGRPEQRDGRLVCNGVYVRVAGEAHSVSDQREWGFRLVYRQNDDGSVAIERIETPTRYGMAVMSARS